MARRSLSFRNENYDIQSIVKYVEFSYDLEFGVHDFQHVDTFGEFSDKIISRIKLPDTDDSTYEQGFHKLKTALEMIRGVKELPLARDTRLVDIFPIKNRRKDVLEIEEMLGVRLRAFTASNLVLWSFIVFFQLVAFCFFLDWRLGTAGLLPAIVMYWLINKTAKVFIDKTFGELTERMVIYNYLRSRENPMTVNRKEIEDNIKKLFIKAWQLKEHDIDRETLI